MAGWRATQIRISGKGILSLGHTDRQITKTGRFPVPQLVADFHIGGHIIEILTFINACEGGGGVFDIVKNHLAQTSLLGRCEFITAVFKGGYQRVFINRDVIGKQGRRDIADAGTAQGRCFIA